MAGNPNFYKGMPPANPNGRPPGNPNRTTQIVRELFAQILESEQENFKAALEQLRVNSPKDYVQVMTKLSQRFLPEMTTTQLAGIDGQPIQPLQIILPSPNDSSRSRDLKGPTESPELLSGPDADDPDGGDSPDA